MSSCLTSDVIGICLDNAPCKSLLQEDGSSYVLQKYYTPVKSRTKVDYSTKELTDYPVNERVVLFGNYVMANTTFEFERLTESKVRVVVKIDFPSVAKIYGKSPLSDFLSK